MTELNRGEFLNDRVRGSTWPFVLPVLVIGSFVLLFEGLAWNLPVSLRSLETSVEIRGDSKHPMAQPQEHWHAYRWHSVFAVRVCGVFTFRVENATSLQRPYKVGGELVSFSLKLKTTSYLDLFFSFTALELNWKHFKHTLFVTEITALQTQCLFDRVRCIPQNIANR